MDFLSEKVILYDLHLGKVNMEMDESKLRLNKSGGKKTIAAVQ